MAAYEVKTDVEAVAGSLVLKKAQELFQSGLLTSGRPGRRLLPTATTGIFYPPPLRPVRAVRDTVVEVLELAQVDASAR